MGLAQGRFERFAADLAGRPGGESATDEAGRSFQEKMGKWRSQLDEIAAGLENSLSYYGDMVIGVGRDYAEEEIAGGLEVVSEEFRLKQNAYLIPYAERFVNHLRAYRSAGAADKAVWQRDLAGIESTSNP
jgi:hypothetical protein